MNLLVFVVYRFYVIKLSQRERKAYKINSEASIFDQIYVITILHLAKRVTEKTQDLKLLLIWKKIMFCINLLYYFYGGRLEDF